jgi:hypothetical protein
MRNRRAFFPGAVAAAAVLLAGTAVMAQVPPSLTTCTTQFQSATFTVASGPTFVPCEAPGGVTQCTEIEYQLVSGSFQPVYVLAGKGVVDVVPRGPDTLVADPCDGVDGFGEDACHQQAIRTLPDEDRTFKIIVAGERSPGPSSVGVDSEGVEACEILGIGVENTRNPDQVTQTTETVDFKGCMVEFTRDATTGEVMRARLTEDSPEDCTSPFLDEGRILRPQPVADLEIRLRGGPTLGKGKFGDGYISTGDESCTTRVIGGKLYTWGSPCPP